MPSSVRFVGEHKEKPTKKESSVTLVGNSKPQSSVRFIQPSGEPSSIPASGNTTVSGSGGTIARGLRRGIEQSQGLFGQLISLVGDATGFAKMVDVGDELVQEAFVEAITNPPDITEIGDIDSVGDAVTFLGQNFGEQIPNLALAVGTGGIGGYVAKRALVRAAMGNLSAKSAAGTAGQYIAKDYVNKFLKSSLGKAAKQKALVRGGLAGTFGGFLPINTGEIIQEQRDAYEAGEAEGPAELGKSLALGAVSSAFEVLGFGIVAKTFFGNAKREVIDHTLGMVLSRVGHTTLVGLAAEGGTEAVQEALVIASRKLNDPTFSVSEAINSTEGLKRIAFAGLSGAAIGGPLGGVGGATVSTAHLAKLGMQKARLRRFTQPARDVLNELSAHTKQEETGEARGLFDFEVMQKNFTATVEKVKDSAKETWRTVANRKISPDAVNDGNVNGSINATKEQQRTATEEIEREEETLEQLKLRTEENTTKVVDAVHELRKVIWNFATPKAGEGRPTDKHDTVVRNAVKEATALLEKANTASAEELADIANEILAFVEAMTVKGQADPFLVPVHKLMRLVDTFSKKATQAVSKTKTDINQSLKFLRQKKAELNKAVADLPKTADMTISPTREQAELNAHVQGAVPETAAPAASANNVLQTPQGESARAMARVRSGKKRAVFIRGIGADVQNLPRKLATLMGRHNLVPIPDPQNDRIVLVREADRDTPIGTLERADFATPIEALVAGDPTKIVAVTQLDAPRDKGGKVVSNEAATLKDAATRKLGKDQEVRPMPDAVMESVQESNDEAEAFAIQLPVELSLELKGVVPVVDEEGNPVLDDTGQPASTDYFVQQSQLYVRMPTSRRLVPAYMDDEGVLRREDHKAFKLFDDEDHVDGALELPTNKERFTKDVMTPESLTTVKVGDKLLLRGLLPNNRTAEMEMQLRKARDRGNEAAYWGLTPAQRKAAQTKEGKKKYRGSKYVARARRILKREDSDTLLVNRQGQATKANRPTVYGPWEFFHLHEVAALGNILDVGSTTKFDNFSKAHLHFYEGMASLLMDYGYELDFNPKLDPKKIIHWNTTYAESVALQPTMQKLARLAEKMGPAVRESYSEKVAKGKLPPLQEDAFVTSKIRKYKKIGDYYDALSWNDLADELIDAFEDGVLTANEVSSVLWDASALGTTEIIEKLSERRGKKLESEEDIRTNPAKGGQVVKGKWHPKRYPKWANEGKRDSEHIRRPTSTYWADRANRAAYPNGTLLSPTPIIRAAQRENRQLAFVPEDSLEGLRNPETTGKYQQVFVRDVEYETGEGHPDKALRDAESADAYAVQAANPKAKNESVAADPSLGMLKDQVFKPKQRYRGLKPSGQIDNFLTNPAGKAWTVAEQAVQFTLKTLNIDARVVLFDEESAAPLKAAYEAMLRFARTKEEADTYRWYIRFIDGVLFSNTPGRIAQHPSYAAKEDQFIHIFVSKNRARPENVSRGTALMHEIGHLVQWAHFDRLSPLLQKQVVDGLLADNPNIDPMENFANWMMKVAEDINNNRPVRTSEQVDNFFVKIVQDLKRIWQHLRGVLHYPKGFEEFVAAMLSHSAHQRGEAYQKPTSILGEAMFAELEGAGKGAFIKPAVRDTQQPSTGRPIFDTLPQASPKQNFTYAGVGARSTPPKVLAAMKQLAEKLAKDGYTLFSGGAKGADSAFEAGAGNQKEIFYAKDATDKTRKIAHEMHPAPGAIRGYVHNLMARNTNQVFGRNLDAPVDFVLVWTPDGTETETTRKTGGTGQAIRMAVLKGVPVINMGKPGWQQRLVKVLKAKQSPKTANMTIKATQAFNPAVDTLLEAIAKLGSLNTQEGLDNGIDKADMGFGYGIKRVFTKNGKSFDAMAETLSQYGYPVMDENGNYDADILLTLVTENVSGQATTYTPEGAQNAAEAEVENVTDEETERTHNDVLSDLDEYMRNNPEPEVEPTTEELVDKPWYGNYKDDMKKWTALLFSDPTLAFQNLFYPLHSQLRHMGPTGTKIAKHFRPLPVSNENSDGLFTVIRVIGAAHRTRLNKLLDSIPSANIPFIDGLLGKAISEENKKRLRQRKELSVALLKQTKDLNTIADPEVRQAAKDVRAYLEQFFSWYTSYQDPRNPGPSLRLGHTQFFFPLMIKSSEIMNRPAEYEAILVKHGYKEESAAAERAKQTRDINGGLLNGYNAQVNGDMEFLGPGSTSRIRRKSWKLWSPEMRDELIEAGFYQEDLATVLGAYTDQLVRRAAFEARFQDPRRFDGMSGDKEIGGAMDRYQDAKQRYEELGLSINHPIARLQFAVKNAHITGEINDQQYERIVKDMLPAFAGQLGLRTDPRVRKLTSATIIYSNFLYLPFSMFSQVVDLPTLMLRGDLQSFDAAFTGILNKHTRKEARTMLEAIGAYHRGYAEHVINEQAHNSIMSGNAKRINEWFFRYNGMEGWTNMLRTMGLIAGREFLQRNAELAKNGDEKALYKLAELDITWQDVKYWDGNTSLIVDGSEHPSVRRVVYALNRFIDEAMIRPDASIRPVWMSDVGYMVFGYLKTFLFGFQETFLRRVGREAKIHQNLVPLIMLGALTIPFALMGYELRRKILGTSKNAPTGVAYMQELAERAGVFGPFQMILDMQQASRYGSPFVMGIAGPPVEQVYDLLAGGDFNRWVSRSTPIAASVPALRNLVRDSLE